MSKHLRNYIQTGLLGLAVLAGAACSDDENGNPDSPIISLPDARPTTTADAPPVSSIDARPASTPDAGTSCFSGTPTTNDELLNACTTSIGLPANPTLPLLNADGSLPAHP